MVVDCLGGLDGSCESPDLFWCNSPPGSQLLNNISFETLSFETPQTCTSDDQLEVQA